MKNINIGLVNLIISNKLKDSYFKNNSINESKKLTIDFFNVVKNSPILQLEFKVFDNLENKNIENDLIATRYIDSNIKLFEVYTVSEIIEEHKKLSNFLNENVTLDSEKIKLYDAINDLILESVNDYEKIDVDSIHESFSIVLNHIKTPKKQLIDNQELKLINEDVIEIAINKFNEKYESLNEDDKNLLKKLIKSTEKEKENLLEEYKKESLFILENVNNENIEDKIAKTVKKINEISYNPKTIDDDIISLHELKKGLI